MKTNKQNILVGNSQWILLGGLFLVTLAIGITAFVLSDQADLTSESQIEKLAHSPKKYYGDEISMTGSVSSVIGTRALTVEGPGIINDEVLVLTKQPNIAVGGGSDEVLYHEGSRVSIKGEARRFNLKSMERELGVDLVDQEFEHWEGKPVVVAETIRQDL